VALIGHRVPNLIFEDFKMTKLFAAIIAAAFATVAVAPAFAQEAKKDAPKAEAKKEDKK
jgi:ribosomal protein L12E/L44/L45/RPP1/RPP2